MRIIFNANLVEEVGTSFPSVSQESRTQTQKKISLWKKQQQQKQPTTNGQLFLKLIASWCNGKCEDAEESPLCNSRCIATIKSLLQLLKAVIEMYGSLSEL